MDLTDQQWNSTRCNPVCVAGCAGVAFCCIALRAPIALLVSNDSDLADPRLRSFGPSSLGILVDYSCRGEPSRVLRAQADTVRPIRKGDAAECSKVEAT
jgi:hypothetical protein